MDMNQRIIFFDVDKTLVDHGTWSVPAFASAALVRLKGAGFTSIPAAASMR